MSEPVEYEYGIVYSLFPDDIHRGPFTKEEAETWVQDWEYDGGKAGVFTVVRRLISQWESVPEERHGPATVNDMRAHFDMPEVKYDSSWIKAPKPKHWIVEYVSIRAGFDSPGEQALSEMLERGWEPFAVTVQETSSVTYTYHLRKQV